MPADQPTGRRHVSRRQFVGAAAGLGAIGLAGCTQSSDGGDGLSGEITLSGSSTVFPLATAVAERFQQEHSGVTVNVKKTGSGGGFSNWFCPGKTEFNNASRPITPGEADACGENGVEFLETRIATDAVTVIVNPEADWVDCMTVDQLARIWEPGGASKWSDVDSSWPDEPFELYGAAETSGTFDYFTEVIVGEEGSSRSDYTKTEHDNTIVTGVAGSKYAMGYLGYSYYSSSKDKVKALSIDDGDGCVAPSLETAKSGEYTPLSRPLFTYPKKSALAREEVAEFARFFVEQSTNRDLVAEEIGYVPNTEATKEAELSALNDAIESAQSD